MRFMRQIAFAARSRCYLSHQCSFRGRSYLLILLLLNHLFDAKVIRVVEFFSLDPFLE
jgi:hypothetical protein